MAWRERETDDPNEQWWNQPDVYEPQPQAPARASYPWWHDPDTDPPSWMLEPGQPPIQSSPGMYWNWTGDHWEQLNAPTAPTYQEQAPAAPTAPQSYGGGGGYSGGGGGSYASPQFNWPQFNVPAMQGLSPFAYKDFSYAYFSAPTLADAQNEPGYAFALEQGQKALENSAAARGTLRTGGTMKDLISWGQKAGEQNYGNVYARAADTYDRNRSNAFGTWSGNLNKELSARGINWGELTDVYDRNTQNAKDAFNAQFRASELTFEDLYRRDRDKLNATTQLASGNY